MSDSCAIQLIDEEKKFNENTLEYFKKCVQNRDVGLNYHVISVFGSQSSGKSSLLNALFNTKFDIMNAQVKRQQTTKGIWIAHTRRVATTQVEGGPVEQGHEYFVLDVEGSDGAERGEDKDFERKAALFALATSEVLLVNMWEQQVGLYQGNNMGLLKTVFEVNLSLFGHNKDKKKIMLLFVIRDFTGFTPLESLSETLISELEAMWAELNKPAGAEDSSIYDFFDLDFIGLSHKLFKPDDFMKDVRQLGGRFVDEKDSNYYLKESYHQGLPLDGWAYYAGSCWEQIENNKDLDLPTQQTLVARFKTEEIANLSYEKFIDGFSQLSDDLSSPKLAAALKELQELCLTEYDNFASRYMKDVYMEKRDELLERIQTKFVEACNKDILELMEKLINEFKSFVSDKTNKKQFNEKTDIAYKKAVSDFTEQTADFVSLGILPSLTNEEELLTEKLDGLVEQERTKEVKMLTIRAKKYLHNGLRDTVIQLLTHPTNDVWKSVMATFEDTFTRSVSKFNANGRGQEHCEAFDYDFHVGATREVNESIFRKIRSNAWAVLDEIIHQYLKEDNVVSIIRGVYESSFRYDDNDVPRLWKNEEEIDDVFKVARERALSILNTLSIVTVDGAEVIPDEAIKVEDDYEDDGSYQEDNFAHILNALQKQRIIQQFKRFANVTVIEAKRSIIKTTSHVPTWLYIMIVVLGWNEFMMVVRNPMFMSLLLLIASAIYVIHKLNLWKPLITFSNSALGETRSTIKNKLKGMLLDEHDAKSIPVKQNAAVESYELDEIKADESARY